MLGLAFEAGIERHNMGKLTMLIEYQRDYGYGSWVREELGGIVNKRVNSWLIRSKEIKEKIKHYEGEVYTE